MEGIGGKTTKTDSKLYKVPVLDASGEVHVLDCYGMEKIASPEELPESESYSELCHKFSINPNQVKRPNKIDLLISLRDNLLLPEKKKSIGKMSLYSGPLGLVFGGCDPELKFSSPFQMCFRSTERLFPSVQSFTMRTTMKQIY